jgi:RimJ/RimL family protein N-acetyltransferase
VTEPDGSGKDAHRIATDLIATDRLVLRRLTLAEARAVVALERDGRGWAADYPTEGDLVVAGIAVEAGEHYDETGDFGVYQVLLVESGEVVGGIGFIHPPEAGAAEVGYGLAESARGRGLATEALRAVVARAAELGVTTVVAMTGVDNVASQRVLERLAFRRLATVVEDDEDGPMHHWELAIGQEPHADPA